MTEIERKNDEDKEKNDGDRKYVLERKKIDDDLAS